MAKRGPKGPSKPLDDKDFDKLINMVRIQCTQDEICNIMGMSEDTLDRRLKDRGYKNFADCYKKHGDEGKASLRRQQWKAAQDGNPTMLVWLGKQMLGQRDKQEHDLKSSDGSMSPAPTVRDTAKAIASLLRQGALSEGDLGGDQE